MDSKAGAVPGLLVYTGKEFRLTIQDDGKGFDPAAAEDRNGHWGLRNMRERTQQVGAELTVETAPGGARKQCQGAAEIALAPAIPAHVTVGSRLRRNYRAAKWQETLIRPSATSSSARLRGA
jgi:hypothetical protein